MVKPGTSEVAWPSIQKLWMEKQSYVRPAFKSLVFSVLGLCASLHIAVLSEPLPPIPQRIGLIIALAGLAYSVCFGIKPLKIFLLLLKTNTTQDQVAAIIKRVFG